MDFFIFNLGMDIVAGTELQVDFGKHKQISLHRNASHNL